MEQDQDETIVVARTTPLVEEETIITSGKTFEVEEATITNPTFTGSEFTATGPRAFGVSEESDPVGPIPELRAPVTEELDPQVEDTFEREVGQVYEAPLLVPTKAIPLPVVETGNKFEIAPEVVQKSKPSADASKILKKNLNRAKRNSLGVILTVVAGAILIGVTLALLWAAFS